MKRLGAGYHLVMQRFIDAGPNERFGRLKLNGQLRGYSPLSRVIEIEALLASTSVRRAMWTSLAETISDEATVTDAGTSARKVEGHHQLLFNHHLEAAEQAFAAALR